jgi:quinol monooxygenase YgiN
MKEIVLNVFYTAKPGMRDRFVEEVKKQGVLDKTLAEAGCVRYEYFDSRENPDLLFLLEIWADEKAMEGHQNSAHMAQLRQIKAEYIVDTRIERY